MVHVHLLKVGSFEPWIVWNSLILLLLADFVQTNSDPIDLTPAYASPRH